jgi:hypothetical protein
MTVTVISEIELIDQLSEALGFAYEQQGEIEAQHRSETAQFGDSWPGAQLQIASGRRTLRRMEAQLEDLLLRYPICGPTLPSEWSTLDDEEPF